MQPSQQSDVGDALRRAGLSKYADQIQSLAKPCIRFSATRVAQESDLSPGASKLGGLPDVPSGFEWPMYQDKPLAFVAQLRLSDVAALDVEQVLPGNGYLQFFYDLEVWGYDPKHRGGWRVFYHPLDSAALQRVAPTPKRRFLRSTLP